VRGGNCHDIFSIGFSNYEITKLTFIFELLFVEWVPEYFLIFLLPDTMVKRPQSIFQILGLDSIPIHHPDSCLQSAIASNNDIPETSRTFNTFSDAGQALVGEKIEARGMVEALGDIKRLVVGTTREPKGEWMRSLLSPISI
jgi:hypothetical protein